MTKPSPINPTIPFDQDGVHHGHLALPYSHDESAWGKIMIPFTVVKNGEGPTALLTGGNHGDEYEGPIALINLANELRQSDINGRVIIVPAFNFPAFEAGSRTSPIDKGNLNRAFPGSPEGTITEKIADYFMRTLIPMADFVLDFHSGGKTLDFIPFAAAHVLENKTQQKACVAAMDAFNAPYSLMMLEIDATGLYDTAVEDMGKIFVTTELRGGGSSSKYSNDVAKRGLRNFLIHAGILTGRISLEGSINLSMPGEDCYLFAEDSGLFEITVDLGDPVKKGDVIAKIWPVDRTGVDPKLCIAKRDGLLIGRHFPGLIRTGDFVAALAIEVDSTKT